MDARKLCSNQTILFNTYLENITETHLNRFEKHCDDVLCFLSQTLSLHSETAAMETNKTGDN